MKNDIKTKLTSLISTPAASGYEWYCGIPTIIQSLTNIKGKRIGDNLVFTVGSGKKKVFISAHMDEVGFFISKIEKDFVRIMPIGSIGVKKCIGKRLLFRIDDEYILSEQIEPAKSFSDVKVYGLKNPQVGAIGTFEKNISVTNDVITSPSLDNKVGCLALIETLNTLKQSKDVTYIFCFACREEQSINGLMEAVREINPCICIDVDSAYALPIAEPAKKRNWQIPTIGKGPALQLMGDGFIIRSENRFFVENIAKKNTIAFQYEIPDGENGATNASTVIANGYDTIQINIPVANQHSAESKASLNDITTTTFLLTKVLEAM